jgi:peptidoglycan/xylan/chitin deacetylase (PgdA/CDA1 family)
VVDSATRAPAGPSAVRSWKVRVLDVGLALNVDAVARRLTRSDAVIFVAHRVRDDDAGALRPAALRAILERLRASRAYRFLPLGDVVESEGRKRDGRKALAFTLDDGYRDQVEVAGPIFEAFDCPATVFLATDFLDGRTWLWWDLLAFLIANTERGGLDAGFAGREIEWGSDRASRRAAASDLTERLKRVPDAERRRVLDALPHRLEVAAPVRPPADCAPADWDSVRAWEARGLLTFGPHTRSHPILARTDDATSRDEITGSWARLRTELARPVPVFAMPNGLPADFGPREIHTIRELGLRGAVSAVPGAVPRGRTGADGFHGVLPRFMLPSDIARVRHYASGIEDLRIRLRRGS